MPQEPDLHNLAEHVLARRRAKDLTQMDVWKLGGPSNSTLTAIEAARGPAPSRSTLRKLDRGMNWSPGSARRVLLGGNPATEDDIRDMGQGLAKLIPSDPALDPGLGTRPPQSSDRSASELVQALAAKVADLEAENARLKARFGDKVSFLDWPDQAASIDEPAAVVQSADSESPDDYDLARRLGQTDLGKALDAIDRAGEESQEEGPANGA